MQENLYSYEARNYNFSTCDRFSGPYEFGEAMALNLIRRCLDLEKFASVRKEIISISEKGLKEWVSKRTPEQVRSLDADLNNPYDIEEEIFKFKLMVKRDAKVKLDSSALSKHPPAQNIMFHRKVVNAIYSPCFDEFKNRFISCLGPNVVFFTEMTNSQFASIAKNMLGTEFNYHVGEVDFSKYDKSQDEFIKAFEFTLYKEFGFDTELLDIWMRGENTSNATTLDGQLSFTVDYQRKSGASNTWIGNTIVTLGILAMFYDTSKFSALFVSGDDSLIFSREKIANHAERICLELGFETKFLSPSVPYFCSKFLVFTGNDVKFLPDPYKLLVKLGGARKELCESGLFEVFTSFRDLTKDFGDERTVGNIVPLVHAKYCFQSGNTALAINTIHCLRSNFSSFLKLFPEVSGWTILYSRLKYKYSSMHGYVPRLPVVFGKVEPSKVSVEKYETPFGEAFFLSM